ncbi:MAG: hypothetical protein ACI4EH_07820 [Oliverpabstia sp.]
MRKKIKAGLSLTLAAAMSLGMLAGCGGGSSDAGKEDTTAESSTENAGETSGDEVPTFKVAVVRWTDAWSTDFTESGVMKQLEEQAGVNIEWQVYYMSDWAEQKSLLLASGDLPDAFFGSLCLNASDISQNKDYFVELTDLIPDNMPNLTAIFEKDAEMKAVCTSRDGKIYSLPKKLPLRPLACGNAAYINKEWLDNLNLEVPKTYKELEEVLIAFANEDADGDGDPTNEIPISNCAASTLLSGDLRNILSPFGTMVSRQDNYMGLNSDGEPVFMPVQENYKEAVKWMRQLWEEGVIDPEYFTQDSSMLTAKKQAEGGSQVGLIYGWTADAEVGSNVDQFELLEAVEGYDGKHYVEAASNYLDIADRELVITNACQDPGKLLQWADLLYDNEVSLQTYYGSIPDQVAKNDDGTYSLVIPEDGTTLDTSAWVNSFRDHGPKYMDPEFESKVVLPTDQGDGVKLAQDDVNGKYVTDGKNCGLPILQYTDEELAQITSIGTDINKYVEAQYAHWVVDGGVEEEWDGYIKQLKAMGLDQLTGIYETAYSAYLDNLK